MRSAADMLDVGWPDPAAVLHRTESTRSCWASSRMSAKVCTVMAVSSSCRPQLQLCHGGPGQDPAGRRNAAVRSDHDERDFAERSGLTRARASVRHHEALLTG